MDNYISSQNLIIKNIFKGVIISIICTLIFLLVFSAILTYTNVTEDSIPIVIIAITAVSILIGSSLSNFKIKKNGIINGGFIGGIYFLLIYLFSSFINMNFCFNTKSFILIIVGIFFGILGGIIGVNKK